MQEQIFQEKIFIATSEEKEADETVSFIVKVSGYFCQGGGYPIDIDQNYCIQKYSVTLNHEDHAWFLNLQPLWSISSKDEEFKLGGFPRSAFYQPQSHLLSSQNMLLLHEDIVKGKTIRFRNDQFSFFVTTISNYGLNRLLTTIMPEHIPKDGVHAVSVAAPGINLLLAGATFYYSYKGWQRSMRKIAESLQDLTRINRKQEKFQGKLANTKEKEYPHRVELLRQILAHLAAKETYENADLNRRRTRRLLYVVGMVISVAIAFTALITLIAIFFHISVIPSAISVIAPLFVLALGVVFSFVNSYYAIIKEQKTKDEALILDSLRPLVENYFRHDAKDPEINGYIVSDLSESTYRQPQKQKTRETKTANLFGFDTCFRIIISACLILATVAVLMHLSSIIILIPSVIAAVLSVGITICQVYYYKHTEDKKNRHELVLDTATEFSHGNAKNEADLLPPVDKMIRNAENIIRTAGAADIEGTTRSKNILIERKNGEIAQETLEYKECQCDKLETQLIKKPENHKNIESNAVLSNSGSSADEKTEVIVSPLPLRLSLFKEGPQLQLSKGTTLESWIASSPSFFSQNSNREGEHKYNNNSEPRQLVPKNHGLSIPFLSSNK